MDDRAPDDWRTWPRERLEREYSPSSLLPSIDPYLRDCADRSRDALERFRSVVRRDLRYGDGPDEVLDLFPAGDPGPLQVFFHGGYWQELGKADSLFPAPGFLANGVAFAAVEYTLAPRASVARIVDQARRSVAWLAGNGRGLGFDPDRIFVSGHSAGAHLAAMVMLTDWETTFGLPPDTVRGGVLVSGVYDLEPLVGTYINDALGLDAAAARAVSPLRVMPRGEAALPPLPFVDARLPVPLPRAPAAARPIPAVVAWGADETAEFRRQGLEFAAAWAAVGHPVDAFEVPYRNHFDLPLDLGDPGTQLGAAAYRQLGLRCG